MSKTILYFHGFASSSNSNKAKVLKKYISENYKNAEIIIPDLDNNFKMAVSQIHKLIESAKHPIVFIGSSLGGWLTSRWSIKKSERSMRYIICIIILILALRLWIY